MPIEDFMGGNAVLIGVALLIVLVVNVLVGAINSTGGPHYDGH